MVQRREVTYLSLLLGFMVKVFDLLFFLISFDYCVESVCGFVACLILFYFPFRTGVPVLARVVCVWWGFRCWSAVFTTGGWGLSGERT